LRSSRILLAAAQLFAAALAADAAGKVFYSQQEAIELAFPDADRVESRTFVLDEEQAGRVESMARSPLDSRLVRVYTGFRGGQLIGYAMIDVHNVRTLPEAFLVVLSPQGSVRSLRLLAFHEPLEYMPAEGWYGQFGEKSLESPLRLGRDVHGIVGATLSARATTTGVRRALALYEVLLQDGPRR
jgi:hypothetical protein